MHFTSNTLSPQQKLLRPAQMHRNFILVTLAVATHLHASSAGASMTLGCDCTLWAAAHHDCRKASTFPTSFLFVYSFSAFLFFIPACDCAGPAGQPSV